MSKGDTNHLEKHVTFSLSKDEIISDCSKMSEKGDSEASSNMEDEIDDALDEGYMGMQCTLERGYSLSEWEHNDSKRTEEYFNNSLIYKPNEPSCCECFKRVMNPFPKVTKNPLSMNVDSSGFFGFLSSSWVTPLARKAFKNEIDMEDLFLPSPYDMCEYNLQRLQYYWDEEIAKADEEPNFLHAVWKFIRTNYFICLFLLISRVLCSFLSSALFLRRIMQWLPSDESLYEGLVLCLFFLLLECFRILFVSLEWAMTNRCSVRLRAACFGVIYQKILKLSKLDDKRVGEILNLFSSDAMRIHYLVCYAHAIFTLPLVAILMILYTLWLLSPWAILGILSLCLVYPIQILFSRLIAHYRVKVAQNTDKRLRMITEMIACIKLIKMYAWEDKIKDNVKGVRSKEAKFLLRSTYVDNLANSLSMVFPILAGIATFLIHIAAGNNLTAIQAIPILALLMTSIRQSMNTLYYSARSIVEGLASLRRIWSFLVLEESESYITETSSPDLAIEILDASFCYNKVSSDVQLGAKKSKNVETAPLDDKTKLLNYQQKAKVIEGLSFSAEKGKLIGVCGGVGSGKSSLLYGLMNQMVLLEGRVRLRGSVAYASQQAWILNETLRENILMGEIFNAKRYYKVIDACSLSQDISLLPEGDLTVVGEQGITLSGGQKQRLSLARALYADKDIYLLDDPLSAIDANVGKDVFHWAIKKALKAKTVLLVTHHLQYFPHCDKVVLLNEGQITESGTHAELMDLGGEYASIYKAHIATIKGHESGTSADSPSPGVKFQDPFGKKLSVPTKDSSKGFRMRTEVVERGSIPASVYMSYIQYAGGLLTSFFVILTFALCAASSAFSSWWLSYWLNQGSGGNLTDDPNVTLAEVDITQNPDFEFYRLVYGLTVILILVMSLIMGYAFTKATIRSSTRLHNKVFLKVLRSPSSYFDTTPSGQIINLFSKDIDEVDFGLPVLLKTFLWNIFLVLTSFVIICCVFPYFVLPLVVIGGIFFFIWRIFRLFIRDLKRLENVSKSPLFSHLNTTVGGLSSILAYRKQRLFYKKFLFLFDENNNASYLYQSATRWLAFRLDFLVVVIILCSLVFTLLLRNQVPATFIGLALAFSIQLSGLFHFTARLSADVEAKFTSVERLVNCLKNLTSEAPPIVLENRPEREWPTRGAVSFQDVHLKYHFDSPLALRAVSFDVDSREKIGVVGRTGSGKSSLGVALFRLVEVSDGCISIDGINIDSIGLKDLRSALSAIPQDPILFTGTVRYNLDPFDEHSDMDLWGALDKTYMKERVASLEEGLFSPVASSGDNFSVGERHLLCLTRALLRKSKIIFLDEATAGIDTETDTKIQRTLQEAFKHCTVITVAHRINTVMHSTRILVMDNGTVAEFDTPANLMARETLFSKLVTASDFTQG